METELNDVGSEHVNVRLWRFEALLRAGYNRDTAHELARSGHVDLHLAVDLVTRGCPHELAYRILA